MFCDTIPSRFDGLFTKIPEHTPTNGEPDGPITGNGNIGLAYGIHDGFLKGFISTNGMWCSLPAQHNGGVKSLAAFTLGISGLEEAKFSARQYIRTADIEIRLETDEATLTVDSFVPYHDNKVVVKVSCEKGNAYVQTGLFAPDFSLCKIKRCVSETSAHIEKVFEGENYAFVTKAECTLTRSDGGNLHFLLRAGEEMEFIISALTNHDAPEDVQKEFCLTKARAEHLSWWSEFWKKSNIHIPSEPDIERYWYGSQYIMACSSKKGYFAPGIFGPFITNDHANWGSDYHLNYNYQAPWWGVFSSNHVELAEPYDRPLMDYIPQAQKNARELLGCNGLYSVVGIGPGGYECAAMFNKVDGSPDREAPFWGQKSNASYGAVNMLMRFYATYDADYAREYAYPYCKQVAEFWKDYLKWDGNRYVIEKDCIHENAFLAQKVGSWGQNEPDYSDDFNPILSLALIRMVMKGLLAMSEFLGEDEEQRESWQEILKHISEYPTQIRNGKKVFRYTESGMAWCDSNSLGIQHIYPARGIGLSSDGETLQVARDTLEMLSRWEDYNAFPTFFTAACYLGYDPDELLKRLNRELRVHGFENLFVYYGGGGLECASAVPATVNNMFLQSHEEAIRIFPVWNKQTDASFENLRAEGAFLVSAGVKKGQIGPIRVTSEQGRDLVVLCPWDQGMTVSCNGKNLACDIRKEKDGNVYRCKTEKGKTYLLEKCK